MFENDFAAGEKKPASVSVTEHAARLKEAEAAGFARGFAQASAEAEATDARRAAQALERVAGALETLGTKLDAVEARLESEAVEVAVAVARKLAPALIAREPLAEIAALATECFRNLVRCPHVAVRVNDTLYEDTREKLAETAQTCGLEGRLVVLADPEIVPGDCRIEWADGGINRDSAAIASAIELAVARYIHARSGETGSWSAAAIPTVQWR